MEKDPKPQHSSASSEQYREAQEQIDRFRTEVDSIVEELQQHGTAREAKIFTEDEARRDISRDQMEMIQNSDPLPHEVQRVLWERVTKAMEPFTDEVARGFDKWPAEQSSSIGAIYARAKRLKMALTA